MRVTLLALALLLGNAPADDARLTLTKSGYSLAVAGDGRVARWSGPVFMLTGLHAGDRVIWTRTFLEDGVYADDTMKLFWRPDPVKGPGRPQTFVLNIWEDPGQHMRVTALVFHAGTEVPKRGHVEKCDVRLDLVVRVADGQSATTRLGDLVTRLRGEDAKRFACVHNVELENTGDGPLICELRIVPEDGRRGDRAITTVTVPAGASHSVQLDGKHDVHAHACRIRVRVKGRKKTLTLHTRPWVSPFCDRGGDPEPPPPPPPSQNR